MDNVSKLDCCSYQKLGLRTFISMQYGLAVYLCAVQAVRVKVRMFEVTEDDRLVGSIPGKGAFLLNV